MNNTDMHYLNLLSQSFPTVADAAKEIINLEAIMNLPKGTEHFLADIHGENEAFEHVLKNASGNIKRKVGEIFGNSIRESEKKELCTLIYYPEQKLELVKAVEQDIDDWYHITIHQLVKVCRDVSSKYTRSKVRKTLPEEFSYIIEELLHERIDDQDKAAYVAVIVALSATSYSAWPSTNYTFSATSMTAAQGHILLWTLCGAITHGTYNGEIMTYCGWELRRVTMPASATYCAYRCVMPTSQPLRTATALTLCHWQPSHSTHMEMTHAKSLCPKC